MHIAFCLLPFAYFSLPVAYVKGACVGWVAVALLSGAVLKLGEAKIRAQKCSGEAEQCAKQACIRRPHQAFDSEHVTHVLWKYDHWICTVI